MSRREKNLRLSLGRRVFFGGVVAALFFVPSVGLAAINDAPGSCINDVGRGAFLWGASDEVTTYSSPYLPYMTPNIYRIPTVAETNPSTPGTSDATGAKGDWRKKLGEVGTIYGTDGKLYEYYFVEGVEPRRIVETHRVREVPEGGFAPIWMDKTIERVEWEPTLIRVLRPLGSSASQKTTAEAIPAPCDPIGPCEPLGEAERQTYADPNAQAPTAAANQDQQTANGTTPPVVGSNPTPDAAATDGATGAGGTGRVQSDGSVRLSIPDRPQRGASAPRPVYVVPKEFESAVEAKRRELNAAQTKSRR